MSQTIGKGRVVQLNVAMPLPETANPKQIQEWVTKMLTGRGDIGITHPLFGAELDPLKIDISITPNFVEFTADDVALGEGDNVSFKHSVKPHPDNRSSKAIKSWKSRKQVFQEARDMALAERDAKKAET